MRNRFCGMLAMTGAVVMLGLASPADAQPFGPGGGGSGQGYGPGMMGGGPGQGYGPGMMGGGYGQGYGPGMMGGGPGQGYGPGMMGGGYGQGYGPGMMGGGYGQGYGPGMMGNYGPGYYRGQPNLNLSTDDVKNYIERMIRNPRLKVGEVKEKDADTITADIVTKDKDALVQRFQFNRRDGYYQPEQ